MFENIMRGAMSGADTGFSEGGGGGGDGHKEGGGDRGWSPLSAKNYYLNTQNFQLQGGGGSTQRRSQVSLVGGGLTEFQGGE